MAKRMQATSAAPAAQATAVPAGSVRACPVYRGELARHRLVTADGLDYVVATVDERPRGRGLVTAAYPVARGYLIMMRQPLCTLVSADEAAACEQHELLVRVLAEGGTGVVRARRRSGAWRRAERTAGVGVDEGREPSGGVELDSRDLAAANPQ